ncbi:hypothetical protein Hanom_Chr04g00366851 [Helianthus anomalus]
MVHMNPLNMEKMEKVEKLVRISYDMEKFSESLSKRTYWKKFMDPSQIVCQ